MTPRPPRSLPLALAAALFAAPTGRARAADKPACLDAHASAQLERRAGHLRRARERLATCADASCPALVARDCTQWLTELVREQPTVVFGARDEAGRDVADARVLVDGEPLVDRLDGRPVDVDPGDHVFRCEFPGGRAVEARVVVRDAEKDRAVSFDLPRATTSDARDAAGDARDAAGEARASDGERARWAAPTAIALGATSVLALGAFVVFGLSGKARESTLASSCRPNCPQDDIDGVHRVYVIADVALVVGLAAGAGAALVALFAPRAQSPRPAR